MLSNPNGTAGFQSHYQGQLAIGLERFVAHLMHASFGEHLEAQGQTYQQTCHRITTGDLVSGAVMPESHPRP